VNPLTIRSGVVTLEWPAPRPRMALAEGRFALLEEALPVPLKSHMATNEVAAMGRDDYRSRSTQGNAAREVWRLSRTNWHV